MKTEGADENGEPGEEVDVVLSFDGASGVYQQVQRLLKDDQHARYQRDRKGGVVPIDQAHMDTTGTDV